MIVLILDKLLQENLPPISAKTLPPYYQVVASARHQGMGIYAPGDMLSSAAWDSN